MAKDRDSVADRLGVQPASLPLTAPAPLAPDTELREALRQLAVQTAENSRNLAGVMASLTAIVGERAKADKLVNDEVAKVERIRKTVEKSAQVQTQEIADHKYPDGAVWHCCLMVTRSREHPNDPWKKVKAEVVDPAWPALKLHANSREEAEGRYRVLCGINSMDPDKARIECKPHGANEGEPEVKMQVA